MRKAISNKIRFEVFKRDSFTCQYCGKKAPDVVLNVDHIKPVKEGGGNDLTNLITSCFECNNGKGARKISDTSEIAKQHNQLKELDERRLQLEMMLEWKSAVSNIADQEVNAVLDSINNWMPYNLSLSAKYNNDVRKWVKKYGVSVMLDAIEDSALKYIQYDEDENPTKDSIEVFLAKIGGIAYFKSLPPLDQKIGFIKAYAAKKYDKQGWKFDQPLRDYVKALQEKGQTDEWIINDLQNDLLPMLKRKYSMTAFIDNVYDWIQEIEKW